jgi:hypothetical protein
LTDEMIDLGMVSMDEKFDRLFDELHALRGDIADVRRDLSDLRGQLMLILAGFAVGLLGVLGALAALAVD